MSYFSNSARSVFSSNAATGIVAHLVHLILKMMDLLNSMQNLVNI